LPFALVALGVSVVCIVLGFAMRRHRPWVRGASLLVALFITLNYFASVVRDPGSFRYGLAGLALATGTFTTMLPREAALALAAASGEQVGPGGEWSMCRMTPDSPDPSPVRPVPGSCPRASVRS